MVVALSPKQFVVVQIHQLLPSTVDNVVKVGEIKVEFSNPSCLWRLV